ncbi:putative receptor protein kinase TMK1-like [Capsicum annuum]|nr:putative receptor protein kinase TMK1-like [Capsicum annuum]
MKVEQNFLVQFIINSLPSEYGLFQMNYNTMKDKWNVHELHGMLVQEETRLKNQGPHFINFVNHQEVENKGKKHVKGQQKQLNVNDSLSQVRKKGNKNEKCHFCGKSGHFQKDCLKRKAWFEKKGKLCAFTCLKSNLTEVPYNTWWIDSGCTVHVSNTMQGFFTIQTINKNEKFAYMGNRVKAPVEAIKTYRLILDTGRHLDLVETYYVPSLSRNLVSLSKLDKTGYSFNFVSFSQAVESNNSDKWINFMKNELKSMEQNEVWELVELPEGCKRVECKWVFKTKRDSTGNIEHHKARLVTKGFTQKNDIDHKETFSPISKKDSLRIIMALVAPYDIALHQIDVKTVFLNGNLEKRVYMNQPKEFSIKGKEHIVCKLKKSIYRLKQAFRQWYLKFNEIIVTFGFKENTVNWCIYLKVSGSPKAKKQFVLIHTGGHGAWCWYKIVELMKSSGYNVTALDMGASGTNAKQTLQVTPLVDLASKAMETFPEKIPVAVFLAALMPGPTFSANTIYTETCNAVVPELDNRVIYDNGPENPPTTLILGPKFLATNLYQLSPTETSTGRGKISPESQFGGLTLELVLLRKRYRSVRRVYIIAVESKGLTKEFQRWMIENNPPDEVEEISGSDHMVSGSNPGYRENPVGSATLGPAVCDSDWLELQYSILSGPKAMKHFVLIHTGCHGAWCWYKIVELMKSSGHNVTALDLGASGTNAKQALDVASFSDYLSPLMEFMASLPADEKIVLVGHSFAGLSISKAMETFPEKISAAAFVAALMPGPTFSAANVYTETCGAVIPELDNRVTYDNGPENPPTTLVLGPKFLATNLYQLSPIEDLTMATKLVRPLYLYPAEEISKEMVLSRKKYGSVRRVYIIAAESKGLTKEFQRWMIENNPPDEVEEISGSDHMVMMSKPEQLFTTLLRIANSYI